MEIVTPRHLAYHNKPIVIVSIGVYFDLLGQFERIFAEGFAHGRYRALNRVVESSEAAIKTRSTPRGAV